MYFEWKMDGWNKNKGGGGLYLHLGQNVVVRTDTIIGIFDIENTSMSRLTRHYLAQAEKKRLGHQCFAGAAKIVYCL